MNQFLAATPTHLLVTGSFIAFLLVAFVLVFLLPGILHWFRLVGVQGKLRKLKERSPPGEFKKVFDRDRKLSHLWKEYQDSLHIQKEERDGQLLVTAVRATAPAEAYFSGQYVVDSRLRTEFFKHLPGLFTGIGIIGTFGGLIEGLRQFQVSEDASAVRTSLEALMHSVGEAFLISAAAITAAMVVTLLEKALLAALYRRTEEIAHAIDAQFDSGAGEEYLSRLVRASEDSASQSKILKDALVRELGDLLRELTAAQLKHGQALNQQLTQRLDETAKLQVDVSRENSQTLSTTISESIREGLAGPLAEIAGAVKTASEDQSASAIRMLNDVMVSFSQRINDLFGGQISGINELNQKSAQAMQDAVASLNTLVGKLEESGKKSTDEMAQQMAAAIAKMEERQSNINAQTQAFVDQIRELVKTSQSETQQKLQTTLQEMGQQMAAILGTLAESQRQAFESNKAREESMTSRAESVVGGMSETVSSAIAEMTAASKTMASSVAALSSATTESIDKLNIGAERVNTATSNFAQAGDRVGAVMTQAATVGARLTEVSGGLQSGSTALQEAMRDYKTQRDAVSQLLADLRGTVEATRREASLGGEILKKIEDSTQRLQSAQKAADEYLDGVSRVLADSSEAFQESVTSTLAKVNYDFHNQLTTAIALLSTAVQDLEVTLSSVGARR